jgi:CubicO group peptidase (beta-lactamase class C family)
MRAMRLRHLLPCTPLAVALAVTLLCSCEETAPPAPAAPTPTSVPPPGLSPSSLSSSPIPPQAPASVQLTADALQTTHAGATFTGPAGWTVEASDARALLTGPEPDMRVAVVDAKETNADEAVAGAWTLFHPGFKRTLKLTQPRPGRHGWDEQKNYEYETSPNEKIVVWAKAVRHGSAWTIVLAEGGQAAFERRAAQVRKVWDSLRPQGYMRESFAGKTPNKLDAARIKDITDMVERARDQAGIPGVGIALIQDGRVVYEGGLGVRELGKPAKVDAHTEFMIASNTKAMTTLLLAKLVDEGKFTWDTPVTNVYPDFKLGDADTTRQVLIRHLICACTGLPRQDMEWIFQFKQATPSSSMTLLGTMQPTTKFGEAFQYSNLMAAAAGFIGGHLAYPNKELGAAYDEAMQAKVFGPLEMTETTFDFARAARQNHAGGYEDDIDGKMALAATEVDGAVIPVRPAGGAWSSVHDVAKYVLMELAKGQLPNGKRLISEEALLARRKPQVSLGEFATYGMGLMVDAEWGVPFVHHGGDMIGYHSDMFWLPDANVGGVILTNGTGWLLRRAFIRKTLEVLFDGRPEAADDAAAGIEQNKAETAVERKRLVVPPDAEIVAKLAKHYTNASLGDVVVKAEGPVRTFDLGEWKSPVASRKNDDGSVSLLTTARGIDGLAFGVSWRGGKRALVLRDNQHEYVFVDAP